MTDDLADHFQRFAEQEGRGSSPLYVHLSREIADDSTLLTLAETSPEDQPAPNLLFAAVQYLLFETAGHPLATYYPSVGSDSVPPNDETYPQFQSFCSEFADELRSLIETRRVQTNAVRRSAVLLPAFEYLSRRVDRTPLGLVEIGPSAGLNLFWDQFGYNYGDIGSYGDSTATVQLECSVRESLHPPLPETVPSVGSRFGIDMAPLDVHGADDIRWLRALIWPEHETRRRYLDHAIEMARDAPPTLIKGDAVDHLEDVCSRVPPDQALCLFNTHALYQFSQTTRQRFLDQISELGEQRDLFWLSCEYSPRLLTPTIQLVAFESGVKSATLLATYQPHGEWIEWIDISSATENIVDN
jgi:hypothetical protein